GKPEEVPFAQYIRVCVDVDEDAARRAFTLNMLGYAMARRGQPKDQGYRGHFGRMGFDAVLTELEVKRDAGTPVADLVDLVPIELLRNVGYLGKPAGAAEAYKRMARGWEWWVARMWVRSGDLEACKLAITTLEPRSWA